MRDPGAAACWRPHGSANENSDADCVMLGPTRGAAFGDIEWHTGPGTALPRIPLPLRCMSEPPAGETGSSAGGAEPPERGGEPSANGSEPPEGGQGGLPGGHMPRKLRSAAHVRGLPDYAAEDTLVTKDAICIAYLLRRVASTHFQPHRW